MKRFWWVMSILLLPSLSTFSQEVSDFGEVVEIAALSSRAIFSGKDRCIVTQEGRKIIIPIRMGIRKDYGVVYRNQREIRLDGASQTILPNLVRGSLRDIFIHLHRGGPGLLARLSADMNVDFLLAEASVANQTLIYGSIHRIFGYAIKEKTRRDVYEFLQKHRSEITLAMQSSIEQNLWISITPGAEGLFIQRYIRSTPGRLFQNTNHLWFMRIDDFPFIPSIRQIRRTVRAMNAESVFSPRTVDHRTLPAIQMSGDRVADHLISTLSRAA